MGFFGRLFNIGKGKAHAALEAAEDATFETTLKQNVREMEKERDSLVRSVAEAMSNTNKLEADYNTQVRQAEEWHAKAKKALGLGKEDLAKAALGKKKEYEERAASLKPSVDNAQKARVMLKSKVETLSKKIDEAKRNTGTLIARKKAAEASKKVAKVLSSNLSSSDDAFGAMARFEESVSNSEAEAKAWDDLGDLGNADADLEKQFAEMGTTSTDDDLAALKAEMAK